MERLKRGSGLTSYPPATLYTIASKDAGGGGTNKWIFGYGNSYSNVTNSTFLHINRAAGGSVFLTSNPWTPVIGRWYHLAVAKSGDNYSFYRDGVLEGTPTTTVQIPDVTAAFEVGRAEGAFHFRGSIDNLRLWNVARTQAEIQNNIDETLPPATAGLAGYWRFNDATGATATDGTTNANHGTLGGGVAARQPAWAASDVPFGKVDVELLDGATPVALLADDTLNDGEFVWTIPEATPPGTNYRIRVTRVGTAVTDTSNAAFTVTLPITVYYVNDATVEAGDWTTAPGNDANDGLSAATPKSSIRAVLGDLRSRCRRRGSRRCRNVCDWNEHHPRRERCGRED